MQAFIADLLADSEIERAELRWLIAQTKLASPECTQREARRRHHASQDLVGRVFAALQRQGSGYSQAYRQLSTGASGLGPSNGSGQ